MEILSKLIFSSSLMIYKGFVFSLLWRWFLTDHFGIHAISIPLAMGVLTVIAFATMDNSDLVNEVMTTRSRILPEGYGLSTIINSSKMSDEEFAKFNADMKVLEEDNKKSSAYSGTKFWVQQLVGVFATTVFWIVGYGIKHFTG